MKRRNAPVSQPQQHAQTEGRVDKKDVTPKSASPGPGAALDPARDKYKIAFAHALADLVLADLLRYPPKP